MTDSEKKEKDIKDAPETEAQDAAAPEDTAANACAEEENTADAVELDAVQIEALIEKAAKADEWHDLLLRTRAEFDNFRKRSRAEAAQNAKFANENLLSQILPVADNFERALVIAVEHENDEQTSPDMKSFIQGVRLTHKLLLDVMSRAGLERIETAPGAVFDPRFHEAMAMVETDEVEDGCIADEFLAGFRIGDRTVRAAAVRIAKAPSPAVGDDAENQSEQPGSGND